MGFFDDIEFEEGSKRKNLNKEELIEALLNKTERIMPDLDIDSIDDMVNYLLEKEEHSKAISCLNSLLDYFPYSNELWQRKAIIFDHKGDYKNAIVCFDKAINLNPNDEESLINKGITLDNSGMFNESIECFESVLNFAPNNIDALFNKGLILEKVDRF
ncbi:MAG TPA: tetratricopeptide repeat protein, partial [Ignavibacteria bacterium]|nr:tetratricopeptide repeat protein [Ignavibacteria bacterium]